MAHVPEIPTQPAMRSLPRLIQGGMGAGVSSWQLARAVAIAGHLGVVSATSLDTLMVRRLQDGDPDGSLHRAAAHFPSPDAVDRIFARWYRPGGRTAGKGYDLLPLPTHVEDLEREQLIVLATFAEVWLAREGHTGEIGINLLTKIQLPTLPSLYGAMLAGVDWVFMGAGIPRQIPGALDSLAAQRATTIPWDVLGADQPQTLTFDPGRHFANQPDELRRPRFVPIVASHSLATMLARKANGRIDGFVVEGPTAGGHNAPPRGDAGENERGEPVYGPRDVVDLAQMRALGLPFWLAGGAGHPTSLANAEAEGAAGIQVGTLFAFCAESGIVDSLKRAVFAAARRGELDVRTDPRASPTGYPFKIVSAPGVPESTTDRKRICDLGYLRSAYVRADGSIGYRCAGEPVEAYLRKAGDRADTVDRRCLCNALLANVGLGQLRAGDVAEQPLLTAGDELRQIGAFLGTREAYTASDVIDHLLGEAAAAAHGQSPDCPG